nr:MAG TPA: hypothetical protein [Caudoviricetes sp.]DAT31691.1 MAG TPA: hypothetical protein [Caudoviricetes sp.]
MSSQRLMSLHRKDLPAAGRGNAGRQRPLERLKFHHSSGSVCGAYTRPRR